MPNFSTDPQKTPSAKPVNIPFVFLWPSLLFIWSTVSFLYGQLFTFILVSVKRRLHTSDCRLQTGGKVQTEGKMQTEDCRPGVKCRLGSVYDRSIDLIVKHKSEVLNILKLLIQSTIPRSHLPFQHKTKVRETGFYCPSNRNCRCVMNVCCYYF